MIVPPRIDAMPKHFFNEASDAAKYDAYVAKSIPFYTASLTAAAQEVANTFRRSGQTQVTILDIGCGTGNVAARIANVVDPAYCDLVLVDSNHGMVDHAARKARGLGFDNPKVVCASFRTDDWDRDIAANSVDIVIALLTLDHMEQDVELTSLFGKLRRILRNTGRFLFGEKCCDSSGVSQLVFERMIEIRKIDMLERSLLPVADVERWHRHILADDILRPFPVLLRIARESGFCLENALGVPLPRCPSDLSKETFFGMRTLQTLSIEEINESDRAYGIAMAILKPDSC